jgi:hypothetical protein
MTEPCTKEKEIGEIHSDVKEILKLMNGNGKVGICAKVSLMWSGVGFIVIAVAGLLIKEVWAAWVK